MTSKTLLENIELLTDEDKIKVAQVVYEMLEANDLQERRLGFGSSKGFITYIADDFDEPLEDFKDYM